MSTTRVGRFKYHSDLDEIHIIREMLDAGFEGQSLFSLDTTRERLRTYQEDAVGLDYILCSFIPVMKENGDNFPGQIERYPAVILYASWNKRTYAAVIDRKDYLHEDFSYTDFFTARK